MWAHYTAARGGGRAENVPKPASLLSGSPLHGATARQDDTLRSKTARTWKRRP